MDNFAGSVRNNDQSSYSKGFLDLEDGYKRKFIKNITRELPEYNDSDLNSLRTDYQSAQESQRSKIIKMINRDRLENLPGFMEKFDFSLLKKKTNYSFVGRVNSHRQNLGTIPKQYLFRPTGNNTTRGLPKSPSAKNLTNAGFGTDTETTWEVDDRLVARIESLRTRGLLNVESLTPSIRAAHELQSQLKN
jgi:hypothetical protein